MMRVSLLSALLLLVVGCPTTLSNPIDNGTDCGGSTCPDGSFCSSSGTCLPDGSCEVDADCCPQDCIDDGACDPASCGRVCDTATGSCDIADECGKVEATATGQAPNVLILLDRSGSMDNQAGNDSRWNVAKAAIATVTGAFDDSIRFGLATYSSCLPGGCSAGSVVVPIDDMNAENITGFLADKLDEGSSDGAQQSGSGIQYLCDSGVSETTTGGSLAALVGNGGLQDPERPNAVLLVTDGEESGSCVQNGMDGRAGAAALKAQSIPVDTYVIGLGINNDTLNQIAVAGGTGALIPANSEAELTEALTIAAANVLPCTFILDQDAEEEDIKVFFNNETPGIAPDPDNGWTYDPGTRSVTLHGDACETLRSGDVTDVDVVVGCDGPTVD